MCAYSSDNQQQSRWLGQLQCLWLVFMQYPVQSLSGLCGTDRLAFHRCYGECQDNTVRYASSASSQILLYLRFIILYNLILHTFHSLNSVDKL